MLSIATSRTAHVLSARLREHFISKVREACVRQASHPRNPQHRVQTSSADIRGPAEMVNDGRVHQISSQGFSLQVWPACSCTACPSCNLELRPCDTFGRHLVWPQSCCRICACHIPDVKPFKCAAASAKRTRNHAPMQVDAYEQGRPGYPLEAVQYALKQLHLDEGHKRIVDLAAGTGKLTRCAHLEH